VIHVFIVWFPLGGATVIFTIAIWVLARAPKSPPIRAFANFAIAQALLVFIEWGYRHAATLSQAQAWVDAGALWPLVPATMYTLTVEIAAMGRRRPHVLLRNLMLLPAAAFMVLGFVSPAMRRRAVAASWGYEYAIDLSPLISLALIWALLVGLYVLAVSIITLRRGDIRARRLSQAFLIGIAAVVVVNLLQSLLFLTTDPALPFMSTIAVVAFSVIVGNAMLRYGLWEIAPQVSATTILTTMQDGVVLVDDSDMIRYINPAAIHLLHLPSSLVGRPASEAIPKYGLEPREDREGDERTLRLADGTEIRVVISSASVASAGGGRVYVFRDVSERERYQERLEHLAYHDTLSGLANREAFHEELSVVAGKARRSTDRGLSAVLMLIDLDRFKEVNDAYGHAAGDRVIVEAADRLQSTIRAEDRAFRLGGDEFAVILRHLRYPEDAEVVARKIQHDLAEPVVFDTAQTEVGASIGYTIVLSEEGPDGALARADAALYEAKRQRGEVRSFGPGDLLPTTRRSMIHRTVREAVRNAELLWYFQPIVNENGRIVGAEALARLFDKSGGSISPAEFIPAAEETGIIHDVGRLARDAALMLLDRLGHPDDFYVTVNVSPLEIKRPELADQILEFMREANAFRSLHLEITETEVLELGPAGRRRLETMVSAGAQVYIDDFGSGYSSLSRLRNLPVSTVKVDRSFLLNWDDECNAQALVQGTIRLIDGLGLQVVAEGVETEDQVRILREAGCTRFQGYYFHKPLPMEEFIRLKAAAEAV